MAICHGNGDLGNDGCCFVNGNVCPLRWKIVGGRIFDNLGTDLGTVNAYIDSIVQSGAARTRAKAQVQGVTYACSAAVEVIAANASLLNDRPALNAAWDAHAGYVTKVRPAWSAIEERLGLAPGEYNCSTWSGVTRSQCCFAEDSATNAAKAAGLSATAVTIRTAGGT